MAGSVGAKLLALLPKAFAEFIATALFVYIGCGTVAITKTTFNSLVGGPAPLPELMTIAMAHGFAIAALVFATATISGGHLNPAVSWAFWLCSFASDTPVWESTASMVLYWIGQCGGAITGAALLQASLPRPLFDTKIGLHQPNCPTLPKGVPEPEGYFCVHDGNAVLIEAILTFVLVFVILCTDGAGRRKTVGKHAPLAIGLAVLIDHLVGVRLTGASMNPARSLGPAVVVGDFNVFWIYVAGPAAGASVAAVIYWLAYLRPDRAAARADVGSYQSVNKHDDDDDHLIKQQREPYYGTDYA